MNDTYVNLPDKPVSENCGIRWSSNGRFFLEIMEDLLSHFDIQRSRTPPPPPPPEAHVDRALYSKE